MFPHEHPPEQAVSAYLMRILQLEARPFLLGSDKTICLLCMMKRGHWNCISGIKCLFKYVDDFSFHCYKVNIRFQMEALYLVEFCLQKWTGNTRTIYIGNEITTLRCHQNSRDQCSNTHTHTYTNKKVLDIVMLK